MSEGVTSRPNVILIVVDCLRPDRLGCYGAAGVVTPVIDHLASRGVMFEQAIAMGFHTLTTMSALVSGCYPSTYGGFKRLAEERPRLPLVLRSLGYKTVALSPNPYLSKARGYGLGFDVFHECVPNLTPKSTSWKGWAVRGFNRLFRRWGIGIECPPYLDARSMTDRVIGWLDVEAEEPFFLWVHYMDVHMPYHLERCVFLLPRGRGQRPYAYGFWRHLQREPERVTDEEKSLAQRLYAEGVTFVDTQIGRLLESLEESGLSERTLVILTADHGEEFGEHGAFGHSHHLYDETIRVPLVFSPWEPKPDGGRISVQVRQLDLTPTLIELAGGTPLAEMQGVQDVAGDARSGVFRLTYDPEMISLEDLEDRIRDEGLELARRYGHVVWRAAQGLDAQAGQAPELHRPDLLRGTQPTEAQAAAKGDTPRPGCSSPG